jgi:trigger factor
VSAATVKHIDPTQVELEISIDEAELAAARDRAFRQLVKNVRIPGFRPGKAPRKIFEAQYGTAGIEERAMDAVVPSAYSKALQENDLEPVDRPQMELLPEEEGQPLRVRATVYVRPQFELPEYKGLALEGPSTAVGADVDAAIERLRKDAAALVPVDRPVALGDTPTIDYLGTIDGVAFDGGSAEQQPTEIDAERFIPGFADGIVGMTRAKPRDVEARFPDDYSKAELAGKTAFSA